VELDSEAPHKLKKVGNRSKISKTKT
jgi:hypothetical protein